MAFAAVETKNLTNHIYIHYSPRYWNNSQVIHYKIPILVLFLYTAVVISTLGDNIVLRPHGVLKSRIRKSYTTVTTRCFLYNDMNVDSLGLWSGCVIRRLTKDLIHICCKRLALRNDLWNRNSDRRLCLVLLPSATICL